MYTFTSPSPSPRKATETENTIASLKMAGNHGADYVEFDVHLTRDHVPVVYHNFLVATTLAREGFFSGELYAMEVKDLTLHQLQSLKLDNSHASGEEGRVISMLLHCYVCLSFCIQLYRKLMMELLL